MSRPRLVALLLALVTLVVFLPAGRNGFLTYDDDEYVANNQVVQNGLTLAGVKWAFTTFDVGNWHPVTWLSHMADCTLFSLNAGAHHFVNVLFHSANSALLFLLLWRLTQKLWPSAVVAALFAWHPLHVESVAWISERKDVLSTFFALLALLSYAKYVAESKVQGPRSKVFYIASLVSFALGLLAKPMLVTLPFLLLLLDCWPLARFPLFRLPLLTEKIPFFLLSSISCVVTFLAQRAGHAVVSLKVLSLHYRIENAIVAAARYLLKIFWPVDLAVIYPFAINPVVSFVLAAAALILISAAAWQWRSSRPYFITGWLWFLGTLVPVIGLVQVGGTTMADRYTYIPSIGIFIAIAFGVHERHWSNKKFRLGAVLLLVVCVMLTERQLCYWRSSETLFRHTLAITQKNVMAHVNLGVALDQQGRNAEALAEYREVASIDPYYHQIHFSIGNLLEKMGRPAGALEEYRECIRLDPETPALHNAAGSALAALGKSEAALKEFAEAERLDTNYALPHIGTAKIFFAQGQDARAVDELWAAARTEPYNFTVLSTVAHYLAANEFTAARDGQNALVLALQANELSNGRQPEVLDILGMAFAETGDFTNAVTCAENALELANAAQLKDTGFFRQRLELYKNHQPWRESFGGTNAPVKN